MKTIETVAETLPPPDFWRGPSLAELAAAQKVRPVQQIADVWGDFWPEDESVDDFISAVRRWRQEGVA